ncbi:dystonin isoform X26 [Anguilla rostrata]|uniref:dystonin isoform X26 n=1 Tax=Anguilla rostrata TaxID=7938 RepID=UPI0030D61310
MAHYNTTPAAYALADEKEYLQAYEDVLERYKDERDRVQKKTFTKWINQHLLKVRKHVNDLYEDLRDGHNLISLLEVLSGESLPREKGRMRFHRLQNVQIALDYLKRRQVKLVNIRNDDITDGNPKLTLGLIWTIILHFQISDVHVPGESVDMTAKERLLLWSQQMAEGYTGVRCDNFTSSWRDGRLFNAIIHKYRPDLVDMGRVSAQSSRSNLEQAFCVAEQLGVARLLDPEDVDVQSPDEKSVITYVSTLYDVFPKVPEGMEGISANDVDIKWVEYQNMVNYLSQWIKHHVAVMSDRTFPSNPAELKALYTQYLQFKENEIPIKENEKTKIKQLYKMLEAWIEFGRIQLPHGYHPNDVEKEWGKLIIGMLEREKSLRPEVDRLEMLQQISNRVQQNCVLGEDKLALARGALQADTKRLESGIQFQHEAEIAGYLLECEHILRQQVVDIQVLLDGKFYLADQLVQKVSSLRDELLTLRGECSSVYSKGRTLTSEQTKMMISGITQSLSSGFSSNLNMGLTGGGLGGGLAGGGLGGGGLTSGLSQTCLPPSLPSMVAPSLQPAGLPAYMGGVVGAGGAVDPGALQQLKLIQIRKPLLKSSMVDSNMSEEEVNMNFVQDLLSWVEEMQVQLDRGEWGSDLPSVETHLENHKSMHRAIEEFQMSLKEAKHSEIQMTSPMKQNYSEKLGNLETHYGKLLNTSKTRQKNLESLHDLVSRATQELIWLNEKEEEEVAFDWSDRNANISKKRDYHADLMRELDDKEGAIRSVQDRAEQLLGGNHPARLTIEAYRAAMQTQWSWILQLCGCVEQHLRENAVYFEFFSDAKDAQDYLKGLQDTIQRKYGCDRSSSLHRLEDLVQESMDEKEQLLQYRSIVAGLMGRAKSIVQLKPRSSDHPVRTSIPVRAICDYRQIEITIYKEDECVLANNSHRAKWKVISPSGNEAMVPSVCFTVPPPNKEAVELASRIEQLYQNVLALWHHSHINMKSVVSWHYLMTDIKAIRSASVSSAKTLLPGEHQLVLSNLQSHLECFLEDSDESEVFSMADRTQLEREVDACREYYEELLRSAEREEHEESVYNIFISELRTFRMRLEGYEERLLRQIRTPLDRDDLEESMRRIVDQEAMQNELDRLKEDLEALKEKCEAFVSQASASLLAPTLSSELSVLLHSMSQVYSMSSVYLEKLKSVSLVVKHSQVAESLVKLYEAKLCEEDGVCADGKTIETVMSMLKQWRSEIDEKREVFHDLEDELQKARAISDRMFKTHNERDFDLDWHKEKADQLSERWHSVHAQIESRLRDLEGIGKSLKYYRDAYGSLDEWVREMEANQRSMQENQPEDSKALAELLNQQKVLVSEIEQKHGRIEECQKYSEQYSAAVKDYELQLMTYRAMVDSQHKSPIKRRRMQSSSDAIQQEFMDLRTRYTALVTLMTQYVKFASETLKRTEEEEKSIEEEKKEHGDKVSKLLGWMSSVKTSLSKEDKCLTDGKHSPESASKPQISMEELATKKEQIAEALRTTQLLLTKHSDKMTENEKQEAKEQLKSLHQAYSELSQQCADQTPTAQQEYQTIEGVLEVESGKVYSVCRSVQGGLIDQTTGLSLLEAQLITSRLILPEFRMCLDLDDAFKHNLVDEPTYWQLQDLNEAHKCIVGERFASEPLPVIAALREGAVSERLAMKVIEIQLATGGLRLTYTGDVLNLEKAFQCGLIPASLFIRILERQNNWKDLIDPNTAEKVSLVQLVQRSLVHEETGLRLLPVKKGREGTISLKSGREISILRAVHEGLIDRETMFRLLGAQLFAGGIVDPKTGRKLTVEEALAEGFIDQDTASGVLSHQAQNGGIVNPRNGERLTVDEAVQCDLMSSSSALLVLERQKGFMGLVWPQSGEILTVTASLQHEIITEQFAYKLLSNRQKMAAFYIPENSEVIDIDSAAKEGYIDRYTADVLKTIEIPDVFPDIDELNLRFSTWLSLRELQIEGSHRSVEDLAIDEKCINSPSPTEAKQLFISYLMMNSYMDPKSGQRLLIFDGQLNKITQLFMERIVDSGHDPEHDTSSCATSSFIDIPLNEDDVEKADSENLHFDRCTEGAEHQHRKDVERVPEDQCAKTFLSEGYHVHGKEYEADENKERSQTSCKIAGKRKSGEKKSVRFDFELNIPPESWLEKHEGRISPPDQITHGLEDETSGDSVDSYLHPKGSNAASRPSRPVVRNVTSPPLNMEISSGTDSSMVSGDRVSSDPNPQPSSVSQYLMSTKDTTEITTLPVKSRQTTENRAEGLHPEGLWWDKEERENAVLLLKSQIEEGGILDVTSGKRYDLDAALEKGLVDEEIAFEVLSSQFPEQAVSSEQPAGTILTLREASAMRSISPLTALRIMERQNLLGGFYDSESGSTISISEALEQGFLTDDLAEKVLNSPPVQGDIIGSDGSPISRRAEAINLKPSENVTAQRLLEDQTVSDGQAGNKLGGKKVATMTFDLTDGKPCENRTETQGEGREKDLSLLGNTKQLSEFLDSSPSLAPISHRSVDIQMVPSLEIEGGPIYKVANSSVPDKEYRRQGCTDVSLLGEDAGRHAVIDKSLSGEDYSRQGLTDTSLSSEYVCGKGFINVDLSDEHGRQGIVNVSSSAKDTNGQSFSDVSLSDIDAGRQTVIDVNFSDEDGHKQDFTDVSLSGKDAGKQAVIDKSLPGKDAGRQVVIDKSMSGKDAGRQAVVDKSLSVKDAGRQAVVGVSLPGKDAGRQAVVDMSLSDKDAGRQAVVDVSLSDKDADRQAVVDVSLSGKDSGRQAVVDISLSDKDAGRQAVVDVSLSDKDADRQAVVDKRLSDKDAGRQAVVDACLSGKYSGRQAVVDKRLSGKDAGRQAVVDKSLSGKDAGRQAVVDVSFSGEDGRKQDFTDVSLSEKDAGRQAVVDVSLSGKDAGRQAVVDVSLSGKDAGRQAVVDVSLSGKDAGRQAVVDVSLSGKDAGRQAVVDVSLSDKDAGRQAVIDKSLPDKDAGRQVVVDKSLSDKDAGRQAVIDKSLPDKDAGRQAVVDKSMSGKDAGRQAVIDKSLPDKDAGRQVVVDMSLSGKDAGRHAEVDKSMSGKDAGRQAVIDKSLPDKDAGRQAVIDKSLPDKDAGRQAVVDKSLPDKDAGRQAVVDKSLPDKDAGRQVVVDKSLSDKDAGRQVVVDMSLSGKDAGRHAEVDKSMSGKDAGRQAEVDKSMSGKDAGRQAEVDVSLSDKDAGRQTVIDKSLPDKDAGRQAVVDKSLPDKDAGRQAVVDKSLSGKDAGRHAEVDVSLCGEDANQQAVVDVSLSGKDTGRQAVVDVSLSDKDAGRQAVVDVSLSGKDAGRQAVVDVSLSEDPSRQDIHVSSDGKDSSRQNVVDGSFESRSSICEDIVSDKSSDLLSLSHKEVSKEGNEPLRQPATDNCSLSTTSCPSPKPVSIMSSDRQAAIAHLGPDKNESLVQRDLMPNLPNSEKKAECFPKAVDKHDVLRDESEPIINAPPSLGSVGQINCLVTGGKGYDHPAETSSKSINLFLPPENVVSAQQRLNIEEEFSAAGLSRDTAFCEKGQNQREDTWQEEICLIGSIKDDQSERHKNGIQLERSHNTGKGQLSLEQNVFEERSVRTSSLTWPSEPSMSNLHEADMSCTTDSGHNGSKRKESFMEYIPPKFAHVPECHQRESPSATPLACEQPQISPAGTCEGEMHKMTGFKPDSGGFEGSAGGISGSVSETTKPSDVMVSQRNVPVPPPPALYSALRDRLDQLVMMKVEGVHGDSLRQVEMQALEDIMGMVQNVPEEQFQNLGSVGDTGTAVQKKDLPPRHIDSTSPDLLIDLLKQESQRSDTRKQLGGQGEGEESFEVKHTEGNLPADVQQIQCQLLQIVQLISSAGDPAILKDALRNLGGILGSDSSENQSQKTKGAEKGDSVCAAEGGGDPGSHLDQQVELTSHPQTQDANTEDLNSGESQSKPQYTTQNYLECVGRLQDHADLIEEMKNDLEAQCLLSNGIEGLQSQLEENKSLETQLAALAATLTADLDAAEQLLEAADEHVPTQIYRDLAAVSKDLPRAFSDVRKMSTEKGGAIAQALEAEKAHLELSYQDLLGCLQEVSAYVYDISETVSSLDITNTDDLDTVKHRIEQNKEMEKGLSHTQHQLENTAFEVQYFISEHAQTLSPAHSKQLLLALTATQRAFRELMEKVSTQRSTLELHLEIREEQRQQKSAVEKQREYSEKLQELCDSLTQTENRLIGHQQLVSGGDGVEDLQQYQKEHQALQKDVQANANALTEVLSSTKKFLEENRSKLQPEQVAAIESQLEEAKAKARLLSQRADDSGKELEKVLTTAIKQETEKVAAVEQLEESKNKIEGLLDWISNIGKDREKESDPTDRTSSQNGNGPLDTSPQGIVGGQDDNNGNSLSTLDNISAVDGNSKDTHELDLDEQYNRIKARHQEVLSQQQELIMATQSAQALLDRQAHALSPEERDKLQRDVQELRGRYDSELAQAELQAKRAQSLREELRKFRGDCGEFEAWLGEAEGEAGLLGAPAGRLDVLADRLERQRAFAEDVISHKGDLRFVTAAGQRTLDAAKACGGPGDPADRHPQTDIDTSGVCAAVKDRLANAADRYKAVHSQCTLLGGSLKEVVEKYRKFQDGAGGLQTWLGGSEKEAARQEAEPIAADPQTLQKQLEETKALLDETSRRQAAVDSLRKTADALITAEGDLLTNQDEILETVDDVAERYEGLSKSVGARHERLQVTLTRSLSVQDGLDEAARWMDGVEESLRRQDPVPLASAAIGDALSKEAALEQDMSSRQSSMAAMTAKLRTFAETADPSAASSLQAKMDALSRRFSDASAKHKEKVARLERLRDKVELYEKTSEKVQQFVAKRSRDLSETEGPGKNVDELSQLMQDTNTELSEQAKEMELLQRLSKELCEEGSESDRAQVQGRTDSLANSFRAFTDTVKEREEEVSSCQDQLAEFRAAADALRQWLDDSADKVPSVPASCGEQNLAKALQRVNALMDEWTAKGTDVQDINTKGSSLCSLISVLTSPAKTKLSRRGSAVTNGSGPGAHAYLTNKELMLVQQSMSYINEGYEALGERLKGRAGELDSASRKVREAREEADTLAGWLRDMKNTLASWGPVSTETGSMKTQMEKQKAFEESLAQKQGQLEKLRAKLQELIELYPESPEAAVWKQTLEQIDKVWAELQGSAEERKSQLEKSSQHMTQFQTAEAQLHQWLSEKELMMSVLGPLSVDPNMLNAQKQQVQILLNEFDGRRPQYEQMNQAARAILSQPGEADPSLAGLREQQAAVTRKWEGLTGQLGQRSERIDQASGKTARFQGLLRGLADSTADLEARLLGRPAPGSQPDAVKRQLEAANEVSAQLREERKKLAEAESLCAELSALVEEEYLKADLSRQLETVAKPFKQLEGRASQRIEELNSAFASSQHFQQMSKDFQGWLEQRRQEACVPRPVWARSEALRKSLEEQEALLKELGEREEPYQAIVREGEGLLRNTEGAERAALEGQLSALRSGWEEVRGSAGERGEALRRALQGALRFEEQAQRLGAWADECRARLGGVRLGVDPALAESSASQAKVLQRDVDKHRGLVELLNSAADGLLEAATAGREEVREEAAAMGRRLDSISEELQQKKEALETLAQGVREFGDTRKEAEAQLEGARRQMEAQAGLGAQLYSNKNLANVKAQQRTLAGLQAQVDHLKSAAQGLVVAVPEAEGVTDLLLQADALEKDYGAVRRAVEEQCAALEAKQQGVGRFQNGIREMFARFADLDDELDGMEPAARDRAALRAQRDAAGAFLAKLGGLSADVADAAARCREMLESEASPDLPGLRRDLETLGKQCGKLTDRARARAELVEGTLARVDELYAKLQRFADRLGGAEEGEESQGPVGMETEVINQQLETFKVFQKEEIEPLQAILQDLNWLGQGLIQSAAKNTSTESLERDLENVSARWNTLNKKIAERSAQLHEALLHCGRFQDALESLLSWLTDTEELVANQKPPSAEFKVVKAQIQEQKLLQRLLEDRRPTVELIKKEGGKMSELAEPADREKVVKEISGLGERWDALLTKAEARHKQLESTLGVAQQFHETLEPLSDWLSATEKRLAHAEPIGTQTKKLEEQISQHKALHEDIELKRQNVDQAVFNGMELLKQTTGDEVVVIQGKLDGIKSRYAEITSMSAKVSATLEKALSLASRLQSTHEDLNQWLDGVEAQLEAYQAQAPVGEQLAQMQERQKELLKEVRERRAQVDGLNEVSSGLLELVPWRVREGLDKLVSEDNERYKMAADTVAQHVTQIDAAILKSQQFEQAADAELAWLAEAERKMAALGPIRLEQNETVAQLQAQKVFSMDILRHKDTVDDIVRTGEAIVKSKDEEEKQALQAKIGALLEKYGAVSQLNSERCLQLERAQSLAAQFWETYEELWPWLQETRSGFGQLPPPAIEYDALRQQQEELRQMRELIAEHKPHIDKMNKTGPQLLELSPQEGQAVLEKYTSADQLYAQLKADVKQRAATLDEALSKSTQFHDKIDPMLESLERMVERLRQPPSISVEVEKIREQVSENKGVSVDLEKLQPSYETLKQRGQEMIARSEGADKDISAKAVQDKLDLMVFLWSDIQALLEEREAKLLDVMDLAEKFWCDHGALMVTIKDTQDLLREMEGPGVDPSVVKQQQETVENFKEEIDGLQYELDVVQNLGAELMASCGEPDKPVIKKSIDEVNSAWETLDKTWKERVDRLEEAMQTAVQFQDGLQGMFDWLDIVESKLDSMSPVGTDLETVKQQIEELKEFKGEAYQLQIEMERLNHQGGLLLKKAVEEADRSAIQEPLSELKMLWDNLDEKTINRQHKLEGALLALGQFQHALDELLTWLTHTEELLNEQRKAGGDPKAIEIELAKHHVLQNDVLAHKSTVEAVNKAGSDLMESSAGEEASSLQGKLENLNQRWQNILEKTKLRRQHLDSALLQAQGFHGEIEDMQQWLKDTERQLLASKAVGGLPETAREQLSAHLELCSVFQAKEELYQDLMGRGQKLLAVVHGGQDANTEQDLRNLQEKWESVQAKLEERKVKMEEALTLATEFHNSLQDFINWLTQAEQTLTMASPASLILETVMFQIDEHKVFVTEVNSHREQVMELDKTGTHLKYFSQKQDVVLIKNLLISVQSRWEKVVQRSVERGRVLDDARKRAKQFNETWSKLSEWLEESERALDSELEIANEPDKIKAQLTQHKEFQKALGSKHSVYDTTSRTGRALKDKTSLEDDHQRLDDMLSELRDKWDTVCGKSVERQNKLEEALLFSGQFSDALQALIDWLYRVEPQLADDQPVHGDIDLVLNLIDSHKVFQKELGKRTGSVQALKRSARELIENRHDDSSWVKVQMQELSTRWETVCALSVSKQTRLEQALCQAEEFHSTVHILLEWLAEAEQSLRFHGALPDDEEALRVLIEQHKEFMKKLEEKRGALTKATNMGEAILTICHPDSITTIKHWNTIIKARFEEVQAWARQHLHRLGGALEELLATLDLLENLLGWLQWAETTLNQKDKDALPQEIEEVKALIAEHQTFMEEMTRKQPDVDKITKTHKRKATTEPPVQSHIPILEKGRPARKRSPTQGMYQAAAQPPIETKNPRVNLLVSKWQQVWLLALDRRRKLNDALDRLEELKEFANFDFDVWRKRYMRWMNHKKSRVMDFFRRIDKDQDGKVTRQEFIDGILSSKFPTSRLEMSAVADIFDRDGDGYIDYYEFVAALHPNKDAYKPLTDADKIEDEVTRQVAKCKCPKRFQVEQIGANKYRFYLGNQFGDSQQLRLVRILRSTVMVRVGGGWMALDEFLVKNDPCRVHHHGSKMLRSESNSSITQSPIAKGRTNMELREKFILPEGTTQVMASFRYRGWRSRPSSRAASPNRSNSSLSCPAHQIPAASSTPKTTPIQGSKLRLPGYLSGKGFQSGEEGALISAAVTKARSHVVEPKTTPSRPGSKAGSRGSSRRGSDASDFDISDIQSVCSDTSEAPPESARERARPSLRARGGKPSKIPTPQRRPPPASKPAKASKR